MRKFIVHYKQNYMGETIENSYVRTVRNESELTSIESALYDDPHVTSVRFELLEDSK